MNAPVEVVKTIPAEPLPVIVPTKPEIVVVEKPPLNETVTEPVELFTATLPDPASEVTPLFWNVTVPEDEVVITIPAAPCEKVYVVAERPLIVVVVKVNPLALIVTEFDVVEIEIPDPAVSEIAEEVLMPEI